LCAHRCVIDVGKTGICGVRKNDAGRLMTRAYGEAVAAHIDPIEKKPLFHFLPGSTSLSLAAAGCNFRCSFCQNWRISQATKKGSPGDPKAFPLAPEDAVREAEIRGCKSLSYTYTEPTIFYEYARDMGRPAHEHGLRNVFVTNGYQTPEVLEDAATWLDAANVDLKFFDDRTYEKICGARLEPVCETIRHLFRLGIWIEITTLVVPGLNDSEKELGRIAGFIAGIDPGIPWHVSRYHPDYVYNDSPPTPHSVLRRARVLGQAAGLRYIYIGNIPGEGEDTLCHACGTTLVVRRGFQVLSLRIRDGRCPDCRTPVSGVFKEFEK
jgi:pyruvate formate lyase activating enzyme